jgi:Ecdysteroid kinase-like family
MEVLGKYHALSFAVKDQKPENLESFKAMKDIFQCDESSKAQIQIWFDGPKKQAAEALKLFDNDDLKAKIGKVLETDLLELVLSCIDGAAAEPYTVICHGDCWNNNIMYRYEARI